MIYRYESKCSVPLRRREKINNPRTPPAGMPKETIPASRTQMLIPQNAV